jgi:anti-sigma factor RsiW
MATGATHELPVRLPTRRAALRRSRETRVFEAWRASIWTTAAVGTAALATTALNAIPGAADEIVMATAYTATGILGHLAPLSE